MPKPGLILSIKPHVSDFDFYAKNHPFLLGMYIFFFLCFLLITSTLIFLGQEDPQEQEIQEQRIQEQRIQEQEDSVFETPSKQHELISKRMSKGGWPKASFRAVRRAGIEKRRAKKGKTSKRAEG